MPCTIFGHIIPQAALAIYFPARLPVVYTISDKPVEALGTGLLDDETAIISLDTYIASMMNGRALPKDPVAYWLIMSSIPQILPYEDYDVRKGVWTVGWLCDILDESLIQDARAQGPSPKDLLNKKASCVSLGCIGLMAVLDQLTNPQEPYKRGIMIDFGSSMDYAWVYRSILESVVLVLKNNYDNICHEVNHFAKHVIITGSGSGNDPFMQIFAGVFNLPAHRNAINGCASLGAAINTVVGLGLYPGYTTAVDKMIRVKDIFVSIENNAKRCNATGKGISKELTKHADVILKKSYEVMHGELGNAGSTQSQSNM